MHRATERSQKKVEGKRKNGEKKNPNSSSSFSHQKYLFPTTRHDKQFLARVKTNISLRWEAA